MIYEVVISIGRDPWLVDPSYPNKTGQKNSLPIMAIKIYSEEFKRDAVTLYHISEGASLKQIANGLGVNRITLKN